MSLGDHQQQILASSSSFKEKTFQCSICLCDPVEPVIAACSHRFCWGCVRSATNISPSPRCPVCKSSLEPFTKVDESTDSLAQIDKQIEILHEKRRLLLHSKQREVVKLQMEFLVESKKQKMLKVKTIQCELAILDEDIDEVKVKVETPPSKRSRSSTGCNSRPREPSSSKYHRILQNFTDLENNYFTFGGKYRKTIGNVIYNAFKFESAKSVGTVAFSGSATEPAKVSAIDINDKGLLAMGGTLKTINIYKHNMDAQVIPLYPLTKLQTKELNWSLSWNPYLEYLLAVGDFDSDISVWDVCRAEVVNHYHEHTASKFISVSFCQQHPQQLISAGFDGFVKLWNLNEKASTLTIPAPAKILNLACKPGSLYHFAVSSINKTIYTYDTRKPDKPLVTLSGHTRSVFRLKFLDATSLISASVDGTMRQWNFDSGQCVRTYHGHTNTSKFIGLDTNGEHIACGSEDNTLVIYHEALSKPVLTHKFSPSQTLLNHDVDDDNIRQITAIAWSGDDLCVANNFGVMHILRLKEIDL